MDIPSAVIKVSLAGAPFAGKSALFSRLTGTHLSRSRGPQVGSFSRESTAGLVYFVLTDCPGGSHPDPDEDVVIFFNTKSHCSELVGAKEVVNVISPRDHLSAP